MRQGLAFLAGAGAGAAIALLYAPQSGEKTQKMIAKKVQQGMNQVTATGKKIQEQAKDLAEIVEQEKKRVVHAFEAGVEAYEA
ncbi:MAG TPA: YtxH domain-containing protein [Terriglobia bacterium]|nr:YtxH domain-containing protein [Terriglobia bacterium]